MIKFTPIPNTEQSYMTCDQIDPCPMIAVNNSEITKDKFLSITDKDFIKYFANNGKCICGCQDEIKKKHNMEKENINAEKRKHKNHWERLACNICGLKMGYKWILNNEQDNHHIHTECFSKLKD